MKPHFHILTLIIALSSCAPGHQDFIDLRNNFYLGRVMNHTAPYKFSDSGQFIRRTTLYLEMDLRT